MSNDNSNEQAQAFQVGDTVCYGPMGDDALCVVTSAYSANGQPRYDLRLIADPTNGEGRCGDTIERAVANDLTLISRATPATASAQPRHTAECEAAWLRQEAHNRQWPQHCPTCGGYGQLATPGSWDEPSWSDPCPDCTERGRCPRCGKENTLASEDGDGPCSACGWDYNGDDPFCDDRGAACICPEPDYAPAPDTSAASEPATPAPAATPTALTQEAAMLLGVLKWYGHTTRVVTVADVVQRLDVSEDRAKAMFAELWERGLVEARGTGR